MVGASVAVVRIIILKNTFVRW